MLDPLIEDLATAAAAASHGLARGGPTSGQVSHFPASDIHDAIGEGRFTMLRTGYDFRGSARLVRRLLQLSARSLRLQGGEEHFLFGLELIRIQDVLADLRPAERTDSKLRGIRLQAGGVGIAAQEKSVEQRYEICIRHGRNLIPAGKLVRLQKTQEDILERQARSHLG
jgi:hypothetical protein